MKSRQLRHVYLHVSTFRRKPVGWRQILSISFYIHYCFWCPLWALSRKPLFVLLELELSKKSRVQILATFSPCPGFHSLAKICNLPFFYVLFTYYKSIPENSSSFATHPVSFMIYDHKYDLKYSNNGPKVKPRIFLYRKQTLRLHNTRFC